MPRLPGVSQRDAVRVPEKVGFQIQRQSGHLIMAKGATRLTIPRHDPINTFTMGAIAKATGLSPEEFRRML